MDVTLTLSDRQVGMLLGYLAEAEHRERDRYLAIPKAERVRALRLEIARQRKSRSVARPVKLSSALTGRIRTAYPALISTVTTTPTTTPTPTTALDRPPYAQAHLRS